ncbi:hypothetical protein JCM10212_000444 [Sporobolomyces blumeae]
MPRLSTQPETVSAIPLRSGFFALPFNHGQTHLFARVHASALDQDPLGSDDDDEAEDAGSKGDKGKERQLFVTGVPVGMTEKGLRTTLSRVWDDAARSKVTKVEMLPSSGGGGGVPTLVDKEVLSARHGVAMHGIQVHPLFDPSLSSSSSAPSSSTGSTLAPSRSAIVTFSTSPRFPPAPYPSSTSTSIASYPSFLTSSRSTHSLARPPRSLVVAHVDSWMNQFDARKLAAAPAQYSADVLIAQREADRARLEKDKKNKNKRKGKATVTDVGPVPGSAAEALARHAEEQRRRNDKDYNPDEVQDGEWTLVTGGGKHGKSILPEGVVPNVEGYGGVTVKVARAKRGKKPGEGEDDGINRDAGIKKIVGEGFYRFNKADSRRKSLSALKAKFEEDKARVDRLRTSGSSRGRGGARGGGPRGAGTHGRDMRAFRPY